MSSPCLALCLGVSLGWLVNWGFSLPLCDLGISCFPFSVVLVCFRWRPPTSGEHAFLSPFLPLLLLVLLSLAVACAPSVCRLFCFCGDAACCFVPFSFLAGVAACFVFFCLVVGVRGGFFVFLVTACLTCVFHVDRCRYSMHPQ